MPKTPLTWMDLLSKSNWIFIFGIIVMEKVRVTKVFPENL